jgi:hypothetical protein
MNSTVQNMNSLMPLGANANKAMNNSFIPSVLNSPGNIMKNVNSGNMMKNVNSGLSAATNAVGLGNLGNAGNGANTEKFGTPLIWFIGFLVIFLAIFAYYYEPFTRSIQNTIDSLNMWFTGRGSPPNLPPPPPITTPVPPQDENGNRATGVERVVEKILPPAKEVFTVSKNDYSYYDAAPLCKALGAELATYEEVKDAWQNGADWCNYGWVKGQMAVYPTQKGTYEELQQGPEDQRGACGKPGLNGGYFDNPELRFGVTCSGRRPPQSSHDATSVTSGSTRPLTASGLEFEKKVQQFKAESDNLGILPFNNEKWGS